jgi:hypothetical protein
MAKYKAIKSRYGVIIEDAFNDLDEARASLLADIEWNEARPLDLYEDDILIASNRQRNAGTVPNLTDMLFEWGHETGHLD